MTIECGSSIYPPAVSRKTVIVSATRTPIGSFQGALSALKATELGSIAIKGLLEKSGITPELIEEVFMGSVLQAGLGQSPARQAALNAGLPKSVGVVTVNKVCASGLKAVMMADQAIRAGDIEIAIAGGMESMSNAPYLLPHARGGYRLGDGKIIDSLVHDGLWDPYNNIHMGSCAEMCAKEYRFSRESQDEFAIESYQRANEAIQSKRFQKEMTPVTIASRNGSITIDTDEEPGRVQYEKIPNLKPAFEKEGVITVANASSINDGAAAVLLMSEGRAKELGFKPLAVIRSHCGASKAPEWFTTAPIDAVRSLLSKANLTTEEIDCWEINEAFACVTMAAIQDLKLDRNKVNVKGGAVALGHPIGASGARLLTTLLHTLEEMGTKRGLVTLCNGGGEAVAMIVERV